MECLRNLLVFFLWMHPVWRLDAGLVITQPVLLEVGSTGEATLECSNKCAENSELKLIILKGRDKIEFCSGTTNSSTHSFNSTGLLQCQFNRKRSNLSVTLYGFNSLLIDNYFCKIVKLYPPPYEEKQGEGTIIYTGNRNGGNCSQFSLHLTMEILGSVILICLICIIVLIVGNCRPKELTRKEEENSVYERMAPSTGGERSKRNTESAAILLSKY
ncbi:T-cell-specific surface glycoprotein CD28-like isoform X2 [Mustelus asterias]